MFDSNSSPSHLCIIPVKAAIAAEKGYMSLHRCSDTHYFVQFDVSNHKECFDAEHVTCSEKEMQFECIGSNISFIAFNKREFDTMKKAIDVCLDITKMTLQLNCLSQDLYIHDDINLKGKKGDVENNIGDVAENEQSESLIMECSSRIMKCVYCEQTNERNIVLLTHPIVPRRFDGELIHLCASCMMNYNHYRQMAVDDGSLVLDGETNEELCAICVNTPKELVLCGTCDKSYCNACLSKVMKAEELRLMWDNENWSCMICVEAAVESESNDTALLEADPLRMNSSPMTENMNISEAESSGNQRIRKKNFKYTESSEVSAVNKVTKQSKRSRPCKVSVPCSEANEEVEDDSLIFFTSPPKVSKVPKRKDGSKMSKTSQASPPAPAMRDQPKGKPPRAPAASEKEPLLLSMSKQSQVGMSCKPTSNRNIILSLSVASTSSSSSKKRGAKGVPSSAVKTDNIITKESNKIAGSSGKNAIVTRGPQKSPLLKLINKFKEMLVERGGSIDMTELREKLKVDCQNNATFVTFTEMKKALSECSILFFNEKEYRMIFEFFDRNCYGSIDFEQLIRDVLNSKENELPIPVLPALPPVNTTLSETFYFGQYVKNYEAARAEELKRWNIQNASEQQTEDFCFLCKDGGDLIECDYYRKSGVKKNNVRIHRCRKVYHSYCLSFNDNDVCGEWCCPRHFCDVCASTEVKYMCKYCPLSVCSNCPELLVQKYGLRKYLTVAPRGSRRDITEFNNSNKVDVHSEDYSSECSPSCTVIICQSCLVMVGEAVKCKEIPKTLEKRIRTSASTGKEFQEHNFPGIVDEINVGKFGIFSRKGQSQR